jgi:acid phosphatase family membrane protein YuiD
MIKKILEHLKNKILWGVAAGIVIGYCVAQYVLIPMVTV